MITEAKTFIVVDELGIDPLRDKSYDAILSVKQYTWHTVQSEERHNGPLLSYNVYDNPEYWRILMVYNGIIDMFALKEGMRIKIPAHQMIVSVLNNIQAEQPRVVRTTRI